MSSAPNPLGRERSVLCPSKRWLSKSAWILLGLLFSPRVSHATIRYLISLDHPEQHLFRVTMTVPADGQDLTTALPAWNALYVIRDFAERVRDVAASCAAGAPLEARKMDKQDWKVSSVENCPEDRGDVVIRYSIFWDTPGPFDSELNNHHAFVNLAEVLMYVPNRRAEDVTLRFTNLPQGWQTATALSSASEANSYSASNYDSLVDAPVEAGVLDRFSFASGGAPIHVILDGKDSRQPRLENDLRQITAYELELMGGAPFDSPDRGYTFIFHLGPPGDVGGGGMEHRNSSAVAGGSPEECSAIAAHEFFHSWNVKRIRPLSLEPVDYSQEQYSRALWFAEGVTNTYETLALVRTGLWSKDQFYKDFAGQIDTLQARPARLWQSVEESSLDAWFEGFSDYGDPSRSISYYNKGDILGLLLDLAIRDATDNRKSLDDVMRLLNDQYAKRGRFYEDSDGIRAAVEAVSGKSFKDFFAHYVSGTREIPYGDWLGRAGLALESGPHDRSPSHSAIVELPQATDRQRRIREGLLHGTTR